MSRGNLNNWLKAGVALVLALALLAIATGCGSNGGKSDDNPMNSDVLIAGIQEILPEGWSFTVITEPDKMGNADGLEEPVFRIDFVNSNEEIAYIPESKVNPYLRLHFHSISEKEEILKVMEFISSAIIPVYFAETSDYIVITSPVWINHGVYTEEAKAYYEPLEKALKDYFKGFK